MRIVFDPDRDCDAKSSTDSHRVMVNAAQQAAEIRKPTLFSRRGAASFNTSLEPTRLALSVLRFGFPPFGSRKPRGSVLGRWRFLAPV